MSKKFAVLSKVAFVRRLHRRLFESPILALPLLEAAGRRSGFRALGAKTLGDLIMKNSLVFRVPTVLVAMSISVAACTDNAPVAPGSPASVRAQTSSRTSMTMTPDGPRLTSNVHLLRAHHFVHVAGGEQYEVDGTSGAVVADWGPIGKGGGSTSLGNPNPVPCSGLCEIPGWLTYGYWTPPRRNADHILLRQLGCSPSTDVRR
jgi:hypothetical protein